MLWHMEHGEHEDLIREQMRINRMKAPDWIENKPDLLIGLEFYWKAFWELSTCRQFGYGEGPIPWLAMMQYARQYEIIGEEFDRFVLVLKFMDTEYLKFRHKKTQSKINPGKPKQKIKEKTPLGV